jgi:hypothetical protein
LCQQSNEDQTIQTPSTLNLIATYEEGDKILVIGTKENDKEKNLQITNLHFLQNRNIYQ